MLTTALIFCTLSTVQCNTQPVEIQAEVSAYTASVQECDDEPCISADGTNVCTTNESLVANNCLPFDTIVQIDGKGYRVADRLNSRYGCKNFDILMGSRSEAKNWGRRNLVVKYNN